MVDPVAAPNRIETRADLGKGDAALYEFWTSQDKIAEREERKWLKQARKIVKRYRDERGNDERSTNDLHRFNILWSNVQTLIPTLYARTPKPSVERRFKDDDPVGRLAATLLERALNYSLSADDTFDTAMTACVEDRLLPGRGVARVMYVPKFGEKLDAEDESTEFEEDEDDEDGA